MRQPEPIDTIGSPSCHTPQPLASLVGKQLPLATRVDGMPLEPHEREDGRSHPADQVPRPGHIAYR